MTSNEVVYYPYDRLAIRLDTTHLLVKGFFWLSSYWGVFERVNGSWIEYQPEEDSIEEVRDDLYMHVAFRDLDAVTITYDGLKDAEPTMNEPLDYSFFEEFAKQYDFEDIVSVADGYPPLNSFYDIYRSSRNFIDGYFDGLNNPLFAGGFIGASERDMHYNDVLGTQFYRRAQEEEIKRRRSLSVDEIEAIELSQAESHPVLLDHVSKLHEAAYRQYRLECQRLNIDDDWNLFYPTIKYAEFIEGKVEITARELLEVGEYFSELIMRGTRTRVGFSPIQDPRPASDWYKGVMHVKEEVSDPTNIVAVRMCKCEESDEHEEFCVSEYIFPDGSKEVLNDLNFENERFPEDLYYQFRPILKTLESDENWTMNSYFVGLISEIRPGLYFYTFGDVDEIGERNFYIKGDLKSVVYMLMREWGPSKGRWQSLFNSVSKSGYPKGYEPGTLININQIFNNTNEETLTFGFAYNMESKELRQIFAELNL